MAWDATFSYRTPYGRQQTRLAQVAEDMVEPPVFDEDDTYCVDVANEVCHSHLRGKRFGLACRTAGGWILKPYCALRTASAMPSRRPSAFRLFAQAMMCCSRRCASPWEMRPTAPWQYIDICLDVPSCCQQKTPAARVLYSSLGGAYLDYDVAIAEMDPTCSQDDLQISHDGTILTDFVDRQYISSGLPVLIALPAGILASTVQAYCGALPMQGVGIVDNCFLLNMTTAGGDSGSLIYSGSSAIGMLIVVSSNSPFSFFHPLGDALAFARQQIAQPIQVF